TSVPIAASLHPWQCAQLERAPLAKDATAAAATLPQAARVDAIRRHARLGAAPACEHQHEYADDDVVPGRGSRQIVEHERCDDEPCADREIDPARRSRR